MKKQEITILGKNYSFFTDEPEYLAMAAGELNSQLEDLKDKYSQFSRDHLILLYLLRKELQDEEGKGELKQEKAFTIDQASENEEQLDLEINDILNTEL